MSSSEYTISSSRCTGPLRVAVEGNIGSGKSTFLSYCRERYPILLDVECEPVEMWTNLNGVNLLRNYYEDAARWAMPFQSYVNLTMLTLWSRNTHKPICLTERSLLSARYCFMEAMRANNVLDPTMHSILDQWYEFQFMNFTYIKPHAIGKHHNTGICLRAYR